MYADIPSGFFLISRQQYVYSGFIVNIGVLAVLAFRHISLYILKVEDLYETPQTISVYDTKLFCPRICMAI